MALVHDGRVIACARRIGIEARGRTRDRRDERFDLRVRHERVVGRDARLSRVEQLARHEARGQSIEVRIDVEDRGRLAAQLERDGREVLRGGERDAPPDGRGSGEEQVIERQA
jgi:hypothetical protein